METKIKGWTITHFESFPNVFVEGPQGEFVHIEGGKDFEEEICFEVRDDERSHGYDGDCARARWIPVDVIQAAIAIFKSKVI